MPRQLPGGGGQRRLQHPAQLHHRAAATLECGPYIHAGCLCCIMRWVCHPYGQSCGVGHQLATCTWRRAGDRRCHGAVRGQPYRYANHRLGLRHCDYVQHSRTATVGTYGHPDQCFLWAALQRHGHSGCIGRNARLHLHLGTCTAAWARHRHGLPIVRWHLGGNGYRRARLPTGAHLHPTTCGSAANVLHTRSGELPRCMRWQRPSGGGRWHAVVHLHVAARSY